MKLAEIGNKSPIMDIVEWVARAAIFVGAYSWQNNSSELQRIYYCSAESSYQVAEKRSSAAFPSSFIIAAYGQVRRIPQDFGRFHLTIFEQPEKDDFFSSLMEG